VDKILPPRPDLDHLRRQAKALLAALAAGDADAIETMRGHLPAARKLDAEAVRAAGFRLADAQFAVARKTGFGSWPQLKRHVEQLRALEGTWQFVTLEVDGQAMPPAMLGSSRILIDGDRFRTESPEATYEGVFTIDVEADPCGIDLDFVEGPEAGKRNHGIFRLAGDRLEICLDMTGRSRPAAFRTQAGSGHAFETLRRASAARPEGVTGGTARLPAPAAAKPAAADPSDFPYVASPALTRLQGEWSATRILRDGVELPKMMVQTGRRSATRNEIRITFGGQLMIHALVRLDESAQPVAVDYCNVGGQAEGTLQHGIMQWVGDEACFCMASPGQPRPSDFTSPAGSGRTLSQWRRATT
jgi:uncharacterized protein (TIGR03067 family)